MEGVLAQGHIEMRETTVTQNRALEHGGGLAITRGSAMIQGCSLHSNQARSGGGAFIESSLVTFRNGFLRENAATATGGGVAVVSSQVVLENLTLRANTASSLGGGLVGTDGSSIFVLNATQVAHNTASHGGGLAIVQSTAHIVGTIISQNMAHEHGKPVEISCFTVGNMWIAAGGGLYWACACDSSCNRTVISATVMSLNSAIGGGGLYENGCGIGNRWPELKQFMALPLKPLNAKMGFDTNVADYGMNANHA